MSAKYDVIVVGAGVSGLLSALALSKEGKSVLILEKDNFVGGVCRSYKVQGYTVDTGPHIITRLDSGPLRVLMDRYFDLIPNFVPFGKYYLRINGQVKDFPWSLKDWMMFDLLPVEDRSLLMKSLIDIAYMVNSGRDMTRVSIKDIMPGSLSHNSVAFLDYLSYFMLGTGPENAPVSRFIDRKDYKTEKQKDENGISIPYVGKLYNMLIGGKPTDQYYPKGGIQKIVDSLMYSMPPNVKVNLDEELLSLNTEKVNGRQTEKITGISTNKGEYLADSVIYSGFATDIPKLVSTPLPQRYVENLSMIEKVTSLSVWLGLDEQVFKEDASEMWVSTTRDKFHTWLIPTSNYDPLLAPKGKHLVGFAFVNPDMTSSEEMKRKATHTIFSNIPALEEHMDMIHYQELVPEKATWNMNAGFGDVTTPIDNLYCVGSDSFKRSMGLTRTSYSVIKMLDTFKADGNLPS
ncbi:NAD(P)/FAD-dependent oxidoreductase [Candidatus Bathyarchaeota archaeon]|nr:NAD(P)/FAD-dependent oxidoreductase [Candidatus Bathyarchaeota archaeon]